MWAETNHQRNAEPSVGDPMPNEGMRAYDPSVGIGTGAEFICDLHMVRADPAQRGCLTRLCAILGWQIRTSQQWLPWQRLRDKYGWPILLTALDRCEEQRFPQNVERVCRVEKKSREEYKQIAEANAKIEKSRTEEAQKAEANRLFQEKYKDQLAGLSGLAYTMKLVELRKKEANATQY
jgi:hypothetical protein